jgi:hypothetical protein
MRLDVDQTRAVGYTPRFAGYGTVDPTTRINSLNLALRPGPVQHRAVPTTATNLEALKATSE